MKPGLAQILAGAAGTLGLRVIPALPPKSYAEGDAKMIALLLIFAAQEAGRADDRTAAEVRVVRGLLADAAPCGLEHGLAGRIEAALAAPAAEGSAAMAAEHEALEHLLIDVHAAIEDREDAPSKALNRAIWGYLRTRADSRMLFMPETG